MTNPTLQKLALIFPATQGYKFITTASALLIGGEVLLEISIPILMAEIIDFGVNGSNVPFIYSTCRTMLLLVAAALLCGSLSARLASVAMAGFGNGLRRMLFAKVQSFSFANVEAITTASLITRLTTDVQNVQMAYFMTLRMLVRSPMMLVAASIVAVRINTELAAIFLVVIPVLATCLTLIATKAFPKFTFMLRKTDEMNASLQENLIAIRAVKAYVKEDYERQKFANTATEVRNYQRAAERIIALEAPIASLVMYATIVAVCWFGGLLVANGSMLTGELISFVSYIMQILFSLLVISFAVIGLVLSQASINRVAEVLNTEPTITDAHTFQNADDTADAHTLQNADDTHADDTHAHKNTTDTTDPHAPQPPTHDTQTHQDTHDAHAHPATSASDSVADGSLEFRDVCFSYSPTNTPLNLEHITFRAEAGQFIGIIGETGSAKTTLVNLIPRFYDVCHGSVLVGGQDVRSYSLQTLRDSVAMVLQKNILFSGTIAENLRWGNPQASEEELDHVLRLAQAYDFVHSFKDGLNTDLGQGGVNVSGGQRQRLCIARALLKKPKILILDDSTSALDSATDAKLRQALKEQSASFTTIMITQKLSSLAEANLVLIMHNGRLVHCGSPAELASVLADYNSASHSLESTTPNTTPNTTNTPTTPNTTPATPTNTPTTPNNDSQGHA